MPGLRREEEAPYGISLIEPVSTPVPEATPNSGAKSKIDEAVAKSKTDFPYATEDQLRAATLQGLDLKMLKEETVLKVDHQISTIFVTLDQFWRHFKKIPGKNNIEIIKSLSGGNSERIVFSRTARRRAIFFG